MRLAWFRYIILVTVGLGLPMSCVIVERAKSSTGAVGETCRARKDCNDGLACVQYICTDPNDLPDASVGAEGESCLTSNDCAEGLGCSGRVCVLIPDATSDADADADLDAASDVDADADGDAAGDGGAETDVTPPPPPPKLLGDSCESTEECKVPYVCARGECTGSENGLFPNGNECVVVECGQDVDCCPVPSSSCPLYKANCDAGIQSYCSLYAISCECDESEWRCEQEMCRHVPSCTSDDDCSPGTTCDSGHCVECSSNDDCPMSFECSSGECVFRCSVDEQCELFHSCEAGSCVKTGCTSDAECRALFDDDPEAACVDTVCREPCTSDRDCFGWQEDRRLCNAGFCYDLGCETDEECRIRLEYQLSGNAQAECRPEN